MKGKRLAGLVRAAAFVALLLLAGSAMAQTGTDDEPRRVAPAPELAVLVYHPYPDAADPLGFEFAPNMDAYFARYGHLDAESDGFDFPHVVFDGVVPIEGIPDGSAPYVSTRDAYHAAFQARLPEEPPAFLEVVTDVDSDGVRARVQSFGADGVNLTGASVYVALVEDSVHYAPPPALSNGVVVHPFVVRDLQNDARATLFHPFTFGLPADESWNVDQLWVAAWIQNGPVARGGFAPHEVMQSVMAKVGGDGAAAGTDHRTVLMEMYSATWCDTCLFGDRVAEEMAQEHGIDRIEPTAESPTYLVRGAPLVWGILAALGAALVVALVRLPEDP